MKTARLITLILLVSVMQTLAQEDTIPEHYGRSLNAGMGYTYYRYGVTYVPVWRADFEMEIDHHLTVAPFIAFYSYSSDYTWVNPSSDEYRPYRYDETVIPIGFKISRYLDDLLKAGPNWDFYASGSLGFIYRNRTWEAGYTGKKDIEPGTGSMYLDFHLGTEYHLTQTLGIQLDFSTGMTTFGIAFHI